MKRIKLSDKKLKKFKKHLEAAIHAMSDKRRTILAEMGGLAPVAKRKVVKAYLGDALVDSVVASSGCPNIGDNPMKKPKPPKPPRR